MGRHSPLILVAPYFGGAGEKKKFGGPFLLLTFAPLLGEQKGGVQTPLIYLPF